ncbi:MAG TPA: type II CAAX endopeptidase family protein [Vicinamibacteria bacterium]|nr:type II CAAX endopeptidase family protein [Vicinamibacteria bacterium]
MSSRTRTALPAPLAPVLVLTGWILMVLGGLVAARLGLRAMLVVSELLLVLPALAAFLVFGVSLRDGVGLRPITSRVFLVSMALGATLWALSLGLFELQYAVWKPPPGYLEAFRRLHDLLRPTGPLDALVSVVAIAIAPAACEEVLFRGAVLPALVRLGAPAAAVLSSLLFGVIHLDSAGGSLSLYRVPFAVAVGLGLAAIRLRTGVLAPAIVAHATLNTITFTAVPFAAASEGALPDPRPLLGGTLLLAGLLGSALFYMLLRDPLTPRRAGP